VPNRCTKHNTRDWLVRGDVLITPHSIVLAYECHLQCESIDNDVDWEEAQMNKVWYAVRPARIHWVRSMEAYQRVGSIFGAEEFAGSD
jgi:hypothetical protein